MKGDPDPEMEKFRDFNRFESSVKTGRLTEDLLSEVKSLFGDLPESPKVKPHREKYNTGRNHKQDIAATAPNANRLSQVRPKSSYARASLAKERTGSKPADDSYGERARA